MQLSTLPYLEQISMAYGTIFIGFGILWFLSPTRALSFFELLYPQPIITPPRLSKNSSSQQTAQTTTLSEAKKTLDCISIAYGARDIYMGLTIYAAALCGTRQTLGWIVLAAGAVAGTDGAVCKFMVGKGAMNHWSYAPVLGVLGGVLVGGFDWVPVERWLDGWLA